MEMQRQAPRTPLRSIKLYIRNERTLSQHFEVKVVESIIVDNKLTTRVADKIETNSVAELGLFMGKHGVSQSELAVAGQVMAQHEHNAADFGWFGGFITSFLDVVIQ